MRRVFSAVLLAGTALLLTVGARDVCAAMPTTVVVRNPGPKSSRVQVALGATMPCDSAYNRLVFDEVLEPGATRAFVVDGAQGCARNTAGGTTDDWLTSQYVYGGVRCHRKGACFPDPNVPMLYTAIP
jgi:hypothetical protein